MREHIDTVLLEGGNLRVVVRGSPPVDPRVLALATAIRVFDRYPVLHRLTLTTGGAEVALSRDEVTRLVGAEGLTAPGQRDRWRQVLARAVQAYLGESGA